MKKVLAWVKSNLIIVISLIVAIIALPALLIVSGGMKTTLQEEVNNEVQTDMRALQGISVTYTAPAVEAGQPVEFRRPPNEATTQAFQEYITELKSQARSVYERAEEFNRDDFEPMIEGLFPTPEPGRETQLRQIANDRWLEAHERLLRDADAGMPPDQEELFQQLQGLREQELSRLRSQGVEITPEDENDIRRKLTAARLERYRDRAAELTLFAPPDVFVNVEPWTAPQLPTIPTIWDWQHRLWVHQAVMQGLVNANTDPDTGARLSVLEAPVKRAIEIETRSWPLDQVSTPTVQGDENSSVSLDYSVSITGRAGFPVSANPVFDTRYARLSLVVDSRRIPRIIDAFSNTNFMTVVDMDIFSISPSEHRSAGFLYGGDHAVRAEIILETIWLRSWMKDLMPPSVREALGVPAPPQTDEGEQNTES